MTNATSAIVKKYRNLTEGTLVILEGYRLYRSGIVSINEEDFEKYKRELDRLVKTGYVEEVPFETQAAPFVSKRTRDVLDQDDEPDEDNLFVRQKQPNIFNVNQPVRKKKAESEKTVEEKVEEQETVKDNVIDARPVTLQEKGQVVEDGFEESGRTISCLEGIENWREQIAVVQQLKDLNELDIIARSSTFKAVVREAEKRINELQSQR